MEGQEIDVYIFVDSKAWDVLQKEQAVFADIRDEDIRDFPVAYTWLTSHCVSNIPNYGGHPPWIGTLRDASHKMPRMPFVRKQNEERVRLELCVPLSETLKFACSPWVAVLNRFYLAVSDVEGERREAKLIAADIDETKWPLPEPYHSEVVASWSAIFDFSKLEQGGEYACDTVCVAFERLILHRVTAVTRFKGGRWRRGKLICPPVSPSIVQDKFSREPITS